MNADLYGKPVTLTLTVGELLNLVGSSCLPATAAKPLAVAPCHIADGEDYVGIFHDDDGVPQHHLILLAGDEEKHWTDAVAWAKSIGGDLPTRVDAAWLYRKRKAAFRPEWYWTNEQHAADPQYAWVQSFVWGSQGLDRVFYDYRCRAVRRVPIQSLNASPIPA